MRKGLYILLAILLLIVGCDTKTAIKTGEICVNVDGRSIDPISMETSYYSISVTSGNNVQRAPRVEEGSSPARFNVEAGEWTVVVDAYNDHGDRIGTGSETVTVVGGSSTTCNVSVKEIDGEGLLYFNLIATSDNTSEEDPTPVYSGKKIKVVVSDSDSEKIIFEGRRDYDDAPIISNLSNGRYFVEIYAAEDGFADNVQYKLVTDPIPVRVVTGTSTFISGDYHYSKDRGWEYNEIATGPYVPNENLSLGLVSDVVPFYYNLSARIDNSNPDTNSDHYAYYFYINGKRIGYNPNYDYISEVFSDYYLAEYGIKVGERNILSAIVTLDDTIVFHDYTYFTVIDDTGIPKDLIVKGLPINERGEHEISSDQTLKLTTYSENYVATGNGTSVSGNWYINGICIAEKSNTLELSNLEEYLGENSIEFEYSFNGFIQKVDFGRFYVKPTMDFDFELRNLKAGRFADISVVKTSGQCDGDYSLYLDFFKYQINEDGTEVLSTYSSDSVYYFDNGNYTTISGNYPSEPGKYAVKYSLYFDNHVYDYEGSIGDFIVEEPDYKLDSLYGDNIIQGGMAEFRLNYPYNGSVIWKLDDVELKYYNSNYFSLYRVEWETGPHTIKAVDSNGVEYSYAFNVLPEEESIKFDLEVINLGNYKYEIKVVPIDAVSEDFNYTSTVYVYGYYQEVFNLTNNETVIVDRTDSEYDKNGFNYKVVTSYSKAGKDFTVGNDGYYRSDYYSSNEVSFDKFLYVGNENIIVDIKLEEGYKPDQYQYLFYLDGTLIDIDFEGDGEYLLPMVEEGMHQFEMEILWNSGDSNASYTTIFMHSEEGYTPIKANEVYLSCGSDSPFKENEGGTKTYDYFGVKCSSLVLSDDGYCYFCIIKANDASDPVIQTIPCQYTIDKAGNYIFKISDEKQIVYTKVENRLERVEYDSLLPYSFVKYQIDSEGQKKIYGNWRFITPNFTQDMLNSFIQKYLPDYPISFDETKGEKLNLSLNLSVTGEWINAYLDLSADFTGFDMSLAKDTTIHLEGKIEYEEEDGYLSFMGSRYPIYLQVSEDGTVLLLHVAIPGCPEGTPFIVVPFTRVSSFYNPIVNISQSFNEPKRITIDGVKKALELLCKKQFASEMLSGMMLQEVRIDSENAIEPGKYSVEGDKSIIDVLGEELFVVNGNLCFISENSMTILEECDWSQDSNFCSYDKYGESYYSITKSEGAMTYNVSYEKQGMPYRNGTITLVKNEEGIAVVKEFIGKYMEINDGNNPDDIYIEFDKNGDIYYNFGDEFKYMVGHYGINAKKIVIYADAADIADIMGEEVDGWGVKAGIVLPYDGELDQITLIDDVFIKLSPVPVE